MEVKSKLVEPPLTVMGMLNEAIDSFVRLMAPGMSLSENHVQTHHQARIIAKHRGIEASLVDGQMSYRPKPVTRYEWDEEIGDWFPTIDKPITVAPAPENVLYDGRFTRVDRFYKAGSL